MAFANDVTAPDSFYRYLPMKKLAGCGLAVLLSAVCVAGAKPMDDLKMFVSAQGAVVFVRPKAMNCVDGGGRALDYDWTVTTLSDTVSLTCTVMTDSPVAADSLSLCFGGETPRILTKPLEKIYAEPKGKKWVYRVRAPFAYDEFRAISVSDDAPLLRMMDFSFRHSDKKWESCKDVYKLAIEIIEENRK